MTDPKLPDTPHDAYRTVIPTSPEGAGAGDSAVAAMGDFDQMELIGRGGMGVVYRARQRSLDRQVALKILLAGPFASDDVRARFQREAEAVARLKHANILQIHAVGQTNGSPYLALEYVAGGSLGQRLDGRPVAPREAAELTITLAKAVAHAHERGVVHRDLKPANVLLEPDGTPKIADFGLAKHVTDDDSQTKTGEIVGTPAYMSPEQAGGKTSEIGPACDIYALGAILYELLTGRPPFRGQDTIDTVLMVLSQEPVSPRQLVVKLPVDLETICLKCLAKEPQRRYASAGELAADLQRFVDGRPILARPAGTLERWAKWVKRRPALAALMAVSVVATAVLVVGGILFQLRLQRALDQARRNLQQAQDTVDEMLLDVSVERLAPLPQSEKLRRELLQSAARFCETFLQENPTDPAVREQAGRARRQLADIQQLLGDATEAADDYQWAIRLLTPLARGGKDRPVARRELAAAHNNLANLLERRGDEASAEAEYRLAIDLLGPRGTSLDDELRGVLTRAAALDNLGVLLLRRGNTAEAAKLNEQALAALNGVDATELRDDPEFELAWAGVLVNRGVLSMTTGGAGGAANDFEAALGLLENGADDEAARPQRRQTLAMARLNLGIVLANDAEAAQAESMLEGAVAELTGLAADFPAVVNLQQSLGRARNALGEFLYREGRLDEAATVLEASLAQHRALIEESPSEPALQIGLLASLDRLSHVYRDKEQLRRAEELAVEALQWGQKLESTYPGRPDLMSELAVACATTASLLERREDLGAARRYWDEAVRYQESALVADDARMAWRLRLRDYYVELGELLVQLAEPAAAARAAERVVALVPDDWNGYLQAATLLAECAPVVTGVKGDQTSPVEGESLEDYCARRAAELVEAGMAMGADQAHEALAEGRFEALRGLNEVGETDESSPPPTAE